ncbi:MAG: class I SAM-dependent methyltransferase [Pirellulaceae bacterium]|nr:class I SAM-dependent methyltransferase [Planctomycetales bacterium]
MSSIYAAFATSASIDVRQVESLLTDLAESIRAKESVPAEAIEGLTEYYGGQITSLDYFLHHFAPFVVHVAERLIDQWRADHRPSDPAAPTLLDLGCGTGVQAYLMAARGAKVIGVDRNETRMRAAKSMRNWFEDRFEKALDVEFMDGDAFETLASMPAEMFDSAYTQFAIAYMSPQDEMLRRIDRVLKPGGRLAMQEFNSACLYNRLISKVKWFSYRDFHRVAATLNWTCEYQRFRWFVPRPLIGLPGVRPIVGPLEEAVCRLPGSSLYAASVSLVYRK